MSAQPKLSELTLAADAMARIVARLLPDDADPQLALEFRQALGKLLETTLSGASVMAAGAVLAVDHKVDRLAHARGERLREVEHDMNLLAKRIHQIEDEFLDVGTVGQLASATHRLAVEVEALKARQVGG